VPRADHDDVASVEIGRAELARRARSRHVAAIVRELTAVGYREVKLDPRGYRMGSLNDGLVLRQL